LITTTFAPATAASLCSTTTPVNPLLNCARAGHARKVKKAIIEARKITGDFRRAAVTFIVSPFGLNPTVELL
jgi:hypothetical protein